jgi:hypothetical protein
MKIAQVGQSLVILVAMLSSGCAMETSEPDANDEVVATESTPFQGEVSHRGGPRCAPVIAKDSAGNLYVKELLCPLPAKQLPDPELQLFENQHEWVAGGGDTENNVY